MDFEITCSDLQRLVEGQGDERYPAGIGKAFRRRVQTIDAAPDERTFRQLHSLNYERLQGNRAHQHSMRLNDQYRLILEVADRPQGKLIRIVSIEDYH